MFIFLHHSKFLIMQMITAYRGGKSAQFTKIAWERLQKIHNHGWVISEHSGTTEVAMPIEILEYKKRQVAQLKEKDNVPVEFIADVPKEPEIVEEVETIPEPKVLAAMGPEKKKPGRKSNKQ